MLRPRLATAAVGIPIIIALVIAGGPLFDAALMLIIAGGVLELAHAAGISWKQPESVLVAALAAALVPTTYANHDVQAGLFAAAIMVPLAATVVRASMAGDSIDNRGILRWAVLAGAVLYVGWLGVHLLFIRRLPRGDRWLLLALFTVFATDTGAYATGRLLGRHKLAPRVSPAKTVEGAIGGVVWAAIAAVALRYLLDLRGNVLEMVGLGILIAVAGQAGDLAESAMKRELGIKDMGRIFPGHGGLLDRLDSILFSAPVIYYFVRWLIL